MTELALCVLKLPDGNYVFQRRSKTARISPGLVGFFGGYIEAGETPDEAIVRELNEETSLDVNALTIIPIGSFDIPDDGVKVFLYKTDIQNYSFEVFEGDGAEVYSLDELKYKDDVTDLVKALLPQNI